MAIVCGTDFSTHAEQAKRAAAAFAKVLGLPVRLVHVIEDFAPALAPPVPESVFAPLAARLKREAKEAFLGIWHAAGRLGVDAVCMGTHGRSGASRVLLGSQALEVVRRVRQPVILVRSPPP